MSSTRIRTTFGAPRGGVARAGHHGSEPAIVLPIRPPAGLPIRPPAGLPIRPPAGLPIRPPAGLPIRPPVGQLADVSCCLLIPFLPDIRGEAAAACHNRGIR
jgi:hypothetical protein